MNEWDSWLEKHATTCDQCRRSIENVDAMCEEAFAKLQECLREEQDDASD